MPEQLVFENENGETITEILFRRTIKGIPSLVTKFYAKNLSETLSYSGKLNVVPTEGRSFSEDFSLSDTGQSWRRSLEMDIKPLERLEVKARVLPLTTPAGVSGRAAVTITELEGWH